MAMDTAAATENTPAAESEVVYMSYKEVRACCSQWVLLQNICVQC